MAELEALPIKAQQNPTLSRMLTSYEEALNDPGKVLVRLFEVRDALEKHFGGDNETKDAIRISSSDWSAFGRLTNGESLCEGRHRGKHSSGLLVKPSVNGGVTAAKPSRYRPH